MTEKLPKCSCGGSLLHGSFLPEGFLYQCTCARRWLRASDSWIEVVGLILSDGRVLDVQGAPDE